mgnify:CR=1 FL=1
MLTRWEEAMDQNKDNHNRSQAKNSTAYKWGFLHRAIVDEYVDLIWNCLSHLNYQGTRKEQKFEFIHTHDVDQIEKWGSFKAVTKTVSADLLKRGSLRLATANLKHL